MKIILLIVVGIIALFTIPISNVLWTEYGMVCNNAVVDHLQKYSNVFGDGITFDTYAIEDIGFSFGVHPGNVKECVDFTFEQRTSTKLEKMTIICQNAISDWLDAAHRLPVTQETMESEKLFKQKNDATLTVLNHCNMESLTINEIQQLDYWENRK